MYSQKTYGYIVAVCSLLIPAAAILIWRDASWPLVLFLLWAVAAALAAGVLERRAGRREAERARERAWRDAVKSRQSLVDTLSHHRHDWMNELQILYGYLRMQKIDKAISVVDRIKEDMERDSRISRLGSPELSAYLLSFRTFCDTMRLDARVDERLQAARVAAAGEERVARIAIGIVNAYRLRASALTAESNRLIVAFGEDGDGLRIETAYEGEWSAWSSLREEIARMLTEGAYLAEPAADDDEGNARRLAAIITCR